ncbi:Proline/betaine transporter [Rickettsia tillamookensis]|uniref:Proline/betaine transporter n=1 Tax=Rickettsia tillamookensis TaxID=2761623 RepID=A0A9E6MH18_9RICK|nr:Proline/betaine transporter [Rickettsia tillamookensis]
MLGYAQEQRSLNREQKEAVGLLSIGTFLEFFDFMLYLHMAVLLNDLFFPKGNARVAALLAATAFCTTYAVRPLGALVFGYLGDRIGRKSTVIITTSMMALACFTMANLPTYAQIGITASIAITVCRILQGMSSIGEIIGAELYITEITKPPIQYVAVALIEVIAVLGTTAALGIAFLVTFLGLNWRLAFWFGTIIAIVGIVARTTLRETPEFIDARLRIKKKLELASVNEENLKDNIVYKIKVNKKTALSYFLLDCFWPLCAYFTYFYCGGILKNSLGYTAEQVISQNFIVSLLQLFSWIILMQLSYKIYPLKILKIKFFIFIPFVLLIPFLMTNATTPFYIFLIQCFCAMFAPATTPALPIIFKNFPLFKRFISTGMIYALSRASIYIVSSFGLIYLTEYFKYWGLLFIMIPIAIGYWILDWTTSFL